MKLYTFYSDSHKDIYENFFLESFNSKKLKDDFTLDVTKVDQKSRCGSFGSIGFLQTMIDKIDIIQRAIDENDDKWFVFADCDIQFFDNFYLDILNYCLDDVDMVAQSDYNSICAGFFIAKANSNFKNFINTVQNNCGSYANDQLCMNHYQHMINYRLLPTDRYFTIGNIDGSLWDGSGNFNISEDIKIHHGNYTVGIDNKISLMSLVKDKHRQLPLN